MADNSQKLSCIVGTKNAQDIVGDCLEALIWADEIIIIDDYSTDRTLEICRRYTNKIFQHRLCGWNEQRDFAVRQCSFNWVLALDADEIVTSKLKDEIRQRLADPGGKSGFLLKRLNIFLGRKIKHCGWNEANNLRLFDKRKVQYNLAYQYREVMDTKGALGVLRNELIHYTARSLEDYISRMNRWSGLDAQDLSAKGERISFLNAPAYFLIKPLAVFFYKYFIKAGFLDGFAGFEVCALSAVTYLASYAKLWEAQKESRGV